MERIALEMSLLVDGERTILRKIPLEYQLLQNVAGMTSGKMETLRLLQQGKVNKEIAQELNISLRAAKFRVHDVMQFFKVSTRAELMREFWFVLRMPMAETITIDISAIRRDAFLKRRNARIMAGAVEEAQENFAATR